MRYIKLTSVQVGTKLDKSDSARVVSREEGQALAAEHGAKFCEASAKTRENVRKPFIELVDQIVGNPELLSAVKTGRTPGAVAVSNDSGTTSYLPGCSC